jgi:PAS domain S-box-containing protein
MLRSLVAKGRQHAQLLLGCALIGGLVLLSFAAVTMLSIAGQTQQAHQKNLHGLQTGMADRLSGLARMHRLAVRSLVEEDPQKRQASAQQLNQALEAWSASKPQEGETFDFTPLSNQWTQEKRQDLIDRLREIDEQFENARAVYRKIASQEHSQPLSSDQAKTLINQLATVQDPVFVAFTQLEAEVREMVKSELIDHEARHFKEELLTVGLLILGTCLLTVPIVFAVRKLALTLDETHIQNRKLAAIADNSMTLVALADTQGRYAWANEGFTKLLGYTLEEIKGKTPVEFLLSPLNQEESANAFRTAVTEGREFQGQVKVQHKDGTSRWVFLHRYALDDGRGTPLGMASVGIDVTSRVLSEMELRVSQDRLQHAMAASNDGLWEWNPQSNQMYLSPRWFEMLGYEPGDFPDGANAMQLLSHPDDRSAAFKAMDDHLSGRSERYNLEHRLKNKDGLWQWVLGRAMVTDRDAAGKPLRVTGTISDIHDRRLAQERFKVLFETSPDPNLLIDDAHIVDANRAALDLLGLKEKQEMVGHPKSDFAPEFQPTSVLSTELCGSYWDQVARGHPVRFEWTLQHTDGTLIPTFIAINPIHLDGRPMGLVVVHDLTIQRQVELSLRRSELRYQLAVRGTRQGIWEWNIQTDEVFFTERMCELMGISPDETISGIEGILKFAFPDDVPRFKRALTEHLTNHKPFDMEYRVRSKTGHYRWFRATGQATWDEKGNPVLMAGSLNDITQAKLANLALAKSEAMLTESQSIAMLGSWYYDVRTGELVWSKETFRLFGMDPSNDHPPTFDEHVRQVHPDDYVHWKQNIETALVEGTSLDFEFRIARADGQTGYLWCRGSAKRDDSGRVIELSGTLQDITRVRNTEAELRKQTEKLMATTHDLEAKQYELMSQKREVEAERVRAETASKTKSEFLANMSHEIRTPMTAILGFAEMLSDPAVSPEVRSECVQTIRRNGIHLLEIINDILDLSKIEAGRMDLESIPCKTRDIVDEVITLMRVRASAKAIDLRVEYLTPVPETFKTDPTRLRQILINLVSNAIKFTERGGVDIEIRYLPAARPDGPCMLEFNIRDTGIGMTHEQVDKLFQVFTQADSSTTRKFGGTGLGLAISGRLATLMGGDIHVKSEPGVGSNFTLTILAQEPEGVLSHEDSGEVMLDEAPTSDAIRIYSEGREALSGVRVLLAEDGPDNRRFITFILEEAGAWVDSVENGQDAVRNVMLNQKTSTPVDLVLMDIQMPIMDGYTAARTLRNNGWRGPIIALTAHAMLGERERCLAAGCNEYQTKPVDRVRLIRSIKDFVLSAKPGSHPSGTLAPNPKTDTPAQEPVTAVVGGAGARAAAARAGTGTGPLYSTLSGNPRVAGLIVDYVRGLSEYAGKFEAVIATGDLEAARVMAHHLKGSGTMYGFPTITETASRAERLIKQKTDPEAAKTAIKELIAVCRRASVREKV